MNGILSGLPPGLAGYVASQQMQQQQQGNQLQQLQGMLSIQNALEEQKLNPLKRAQLELALKRAQQNNALIGQLSAETPAPQGALAQGASVGDVGPTVTNAARIPQGLLSPGGMGIDRQTQALLLSGDPGLMALGKARLEENKITPVGEGGALSRGGKIVMTRPRIGEGLRPTGYGPTGELQGVEPIPGFAAGRAGITGAETSATEAAKAAHDIVQIPGQPVQTRAQLINRVAPAPAAIPGAAPAMPSSSLLPPIGARRALPVVPTAGQTAFSESSSREMGKLASDLTANAQKAESQLANIDALRVAVGEIKKAGGSTGAYTPMVQRATELVQGMGVDPSTLGLPKDAGPYQVLDALANKMALGLIGVPGGMPANLFSEADRKFVQASVVQKTDTEAGFNAKLELFDKLQRRVMEQEQSWLKAQEEGKSFGQWRMQWAKHVNDNPLFPKTDIGAAIRAVPGQAQRSRESILRQYGIGP